MIHSIECDNPSFKKIVFKDGLNVILAERTKEATIKDSRNGLGKSTLIEIIHFCLGADKRETLKNPRLDNWTFILNLDLGGKTYSISRNTADNNKIIIEGDCSDWKIKPTIDEKSRKQIISRNDWKKCLGILMFNLQPIYDEFEYVPTFRSLISYFIRQNGQRGGFLTPFQQYKSQREWDIQINNAFLLSLGWEYASKLQVIKDRVKFLNHLKKEAQSGLLANLMGNIGELEALKIRIEAQVQDEDSQLRSFKVHNQYNQIERNADNLTKNIHELVNLNMTDRMILEHYEGSLSEEKDARTDKIIKIYKEAGLVFMDIVTKKIDEVLDFHRKVVANRKDFLANEMDRIRGNISRREDEIKKMTSQRTELMQILQSHGALEEFNELQKNHQNSVSQLKDISIRLENLKKFEQGKSGISIEQELLHQQANRDLSEREFQRRDAILTFNESSEALYEVPGTLSIDFTKKGFKFGINIERSGSHGISNMKIFCYDLMLAKLWAKRTKTPIFLIHDSNIFDGVDERQRALALQLAASESSKHGFQYICTFNSDMIPQKDFRGDFDFSSNVVRKLTDATVDGGLLGIRF